MSHATKQFSTNDMGWFVDCDCGWGSEGYPSAEDAADAYGDHCFTAGLAFGR